MTKEYTVDSKFGLINRNENVLARAIIRKISRHRLSELYGYKGYRLNLPNCMGNHANGIFLLRSDHYCL